MGVGEAAELALGSQKPRSRGRLVEPASSAGGHSPIALFHLHLSPAPPSQRPESPSPRFLMQVGGGDSCVFPRAGMEGLAAKRLLESELGVLSSRKRENERR